MQSPVDPADRTGTIGVEAFDAIYGAGFQASDDSPHAVECELVEGAGAFDADRAAASPSSTAPYAHRGTADPHLRRRTPTWHGPGGKLGGGGRSSSMGTNRPAGPTGPAADSARS